MGGAPAAEAGVELDPSDFVDVDTFDWQAQAGAINPPPPPAMFKDCRVRAGILKFQNGGTA